MPTCHSLQSLWTVAGFAGAMMVATACAGANEPPVVESVPIVVGELPLLFVDDGPIQSKDRVVRTIHAARTLPTPVLAPDRPWEGDRIYVYGSVHADPQTKGWRLWYMGMEKLKGSAWLLYATSPDGLKWTKPDLDLVEHATAKQTNILRHAENPNVIIDRFETDPARRYKMLSLGSRSYAAFYSSDGMQWTAYPEQPNITGDDTFTLTQHPTTGEYLLYFKSNPTVRGHKRRSVYLSRSRDFVTWSKPISVLKADEVDDAWVENETQSTQFYNMSVYPHAGGFVGLATVFRVMKVGERAPGQSGQDGPIDVQMTTSTDGVTFHRTWPRMNVIPRGAPGTFDGGAILGMSNTLLETDDETSVFYTGLTTGHGGPVGPKRLSIGRATWRRDGFASLDADPVGGRIETKPLLLKKSTLVVNADASRGELRVALLEADGRPIQGYSVADSDVLRNDFRAWHVSWDASADVPTDRPVRVVVEFHGSRLFGLSSITLTKTASETGVR